MVRFFVISTNYGKTADKAKMNRVGHIIEVKKTHPLLKINKEKQ